ncbi:Creatinine amidohydrolase [Mucinivorans hirudinis]|uniref:Creatinine amidohydrolase n=1 Tax=Mucinivorans hirudinis TaxID=1433126 RepID=A0A060R5W2_9BACT|nr:Creatinine amidohydrolase [Mucinivorans hirudinis]
MNLQKVTLKDIDKVSLAILPWGAIEPHNYHLPYYTDCILSQRVALEAVSLTGRADVAVFPPIFLGQQNPGQSEYPCCIHTRTETQKLILEDFVRSLSRQGINKLLIVNGHGGNSFKGLVRDLAFEYPDFKIYIADWFSIVGRTGYFEEEGDHADELETSVLMHYHPELVDLSVAGSGEAESFAQKSLKEKTAWIPRNWRETTQDTGIGNPHKSTAEKGERYSRAVISKLVQLINEL